MKYYLKGSWETEFTQVSKEKYAEIINNIFNSSVPFSITKNTWETQYVHGKAEDDAPITPQYYKCRTRAAHYLLLDHPRNNIEVKEKGDQVTLIRSGSPMGNCNLTFFKSHFEKQDRFEIYIPLSPEQENQKIRDDIETILIHHAHKREVGLITPTQLKTYIGKLYRQFGKLRDSNHKVEELRKKKTEENSKLFEG